MNTNEAMNIVNEVGGKKNVAGTIAKVTVAGVLGGSILTAIIRKVRKKHSGNKDCNNLDYKDVDVTNDTLEHFHNNENEE